MPCAGGLRPSGDRSACVPCRDPPVLAAGSAAPARCDCDLAGGVCLPANLGVPPERYAPSSADEVRR